MFFIFYFVFLWIILVLDDCIFSKCVYLIGFVVLELIVVFFRVLEEYEMVFGELFKLLCVNGFLFLKELEERWVLGYDKDWIIFDGVYLCLYFRIMFVSLWVISSDWGMFCIIILLIICINFKIRNDSMFLNLVLIEKYILYEWSLFILII